MTMQTCTRRPAAVRRIGGRTLIEQLWRGESGAMLITSLFFFLCILIVGGIAIDVMRHESERLRLQATADRAVLAGATMRGDDGPSPELIVASYFAAEGYSPEEVGVIDVQDSEATRVVTVEPQRSFGTFLMRLISDPTIMATAPSQAATAFSGVRGPPLDLVMVLDVSTSMGGGDKIGNLRIAASRLAETLLRDNPPGHVALTIVPYSDWAVPPAGFFNQFPNVNGSGPCIEFGTYGVITNHPTQSFTRNSCTPATNRTTQVFLHDADQAINFIAAMALNKGTSIDNGVRMGSMFFDTDIRPMIGEMIAAGQIHAGFAGRPFAADEPGVVRALVLMTDGRNNPNGTRSGSTTQFNINTRATCDALRQDGVLVYTVAFHAPTDGIDLMRYCASSENYFFNTIDEGIVSAFETIGRSVMFQTLSVRLTR